MESSTKLKYIFVKTLLALLIALAIISMATFAWYIYNTSAHTTKLHMAAGSSASLQIANAYDGPYGVSTVLKSFTGTLNPVSTDSIRGGFQKVTHFEENETGTGPKLIADVFGSTVVNQDYYKSSLFIKSPGENTDIYVSNIGFQDSDSSRPISTAIRVGFVVHQQGKDQKEIAEYIFAISDKVNPDHEYNTKNGSEGHVLDSSKTDGTTKEFKPYTSANFCNYDSTSDTVSLKSSSVKIADLDGASSSEPVQIDVYIWLEGCDQDCTLSIAGTTLKNIALSFAGF